MTSTATTVGFIGLGRMGMPMARNLLRAGFSVVAHNRSRGKVDELVEQGAAAAFSPTEVASKSHIVLACLPDVVTVEDVFLGDKGVVTACHPGQVLVDHSTVGPATSQNIAREAAHRGAQFLDAPVSGGVERARDGTLTIMVGGDSGVFQTALPVFQVMGNNVHHVGATGAGSVVKLVNQLLVGIHSLAAAEAMVLGVKGGANPRTLLEILLTSWGQSFMLSRNGPVMIDRNFSGDRAQLQTILKDLELILAFAREVGSPTPTGDQAVQFFRQAFAGGLYGDDPSSIVQPVEKLAGTRIGPAP